MVYQYSPSFLRDVKKATPDVQISLVPIIDILKSTGNLSEIPNLKKLKGHSKAYRIKLNSFRVCFFFENETITLSRFLPRKSVYRFFP